MLYADQRPEKESPDAWMFTLAGKVEECAMKLLRTGCRHKYGGAGHGGILQTCRNEIICLVKLSDATQKVV